MLRNTDTQWGSVAKTFHWCVAVFIFAEFFLGWVAASLTLSPAKLNLFVWHKSIGLLILLVVALRLLWRLANPVPQPPASLPGWQRKASTGDHLAQNVLMLALPVSGWIIDSAANIPFRVFWLFQLPRLAAPSEPLEELAKSVHLGISIGLAVLIAVHTGAALWHHLIARDDVLRRMLPQGKGEP